MARKIAGNAGGAAARKPLQKKRLKLKQLHRNVSKERAELAGLSPEKLPPASSSNAARQTRSRLSITFPVKWRELHTGDTERGDDDPENGEK